MIYSASPKNEKLGTLDVDGTVIRPSAKSVPKLHNPLVFTFAAKGTDKKVQNTGPEALLMYGSDTFDVTKPYYKHTTNLMEVMFGAGQASMAMKRIIPSDANDEAEFTLWIDILPLTYQACERNSDGAPVMDGETCLINAGAGTIDGYMIKYIVSDNTVAGDPGFGLRVSKTGTMDDGSGGTSTMYPLMDFKAANKGAAYNNLAIAIESLTNDEILSEYIDTAKVLPYRLKIFERTNSESTGVIKATLTGSVGSIFTLNDTVLDPYTKRKFNIGTVFPSGWYNETDVLKPLVYNDFVAPHIYKANIATVIDMFITSEAQYVSSTPSTWYDGLDAATSSWFDFTTDVDADLIANEGYLFNIFSLKSSTGVPYFSVRFETDTAVPSAMGKEVNVNGSSPIYMSNGSDGTLSNAEFEAGVTAYMAKYLDESSEVMNYATNVENIIYDSGFTSDTKTTLANIIAIRMNTNAIFGTHDDQLGTSYLTLDSERAIATNLMTRLSLFPESSYFGTSVVRGTIIGGSGMFRDGSIENRVSNVFDFAKKLARFAGNLENKFRTNFAFDGGKNAVIEDLIDIEPSFIPETIKPTLWNDGLNWPEPYDRVQYHYTAYQTVYELDTSVLNSPIVSIAIAYLQTIAEEAWRNYTGANISQAQLSDAIIGYVNKNTSQNFGGYIEVTPTVKFTEADNERGYSWTLVIKLRANTIKTVQTTQIEASRFETTA